jgi:hypothetical protein
MLSLPPHYYTTYFLHPSCSLADLSERPDSPPADIATVKALIDGFVEKLRPKINDYLSKPRLPVWAPPEMVDMETKEFYRNLAIPCVKDNRPSLLLHDLGNDSNPYVDYLFQGGKHR